MFSVDLSRLAERRMLAALAEGKLQNLQGEGKPLPRHYEDAFLDPGEAVGYRIMAEAGWVPAELDLNKQLIAAKAAWRMAQSPAEKRAMMARIADLDMRHEIAREARLSFMSRHHH
ncbi:DUF1992 domain-containing protein [Sinisalibacter aestuarii]|uniref:DUF1992 domain-containing protein n=1 Tax=Sinisalibacter aestuarii TaxID=2949426 RepID=A0ABQ5LSE7_9RHOB|nr:DUF1992 domain-containing protein [Sinisalibacter aestuarii]GKY87176.1 DUF1992 domain-containing protein [Sinisalibacter aestuarii]